jgi:hypothetical protein
MKQLGRLASVLARFRVGLVSYYIPARMTLSHAQLLPSLTEDMME